jgi:hypothetical protein
MERVLTHVAAFGKQHCSPSRQTLYFITSHIAVTKIIIMDDFRQTESQAEPFGERRAYLEQDF